MLFVASRNDSKKHLILSIPDPSRFPVRVPLSRPRFPSPVPLSIPRLMMSACVILVRFPHRAKPAVSSRAASTLFRPNPRGKALGDKTSTTEFTDRHGKENPDHLVPAESPWLVPSSWRLPDSRPDLVRMGVLDPEPLRLPKKDGITSGSASSPVFPTRLRGCQALEPVLIDCRNSVLRSV